MTVLHETESGEHKFKLIGLIVSEAAGMMLQDSQVRKLGLRTRTVAAGLPVVAPPSPHCVTSRIQHRGRMTNVPLAACRRICRLASSSASPQGRVARRVLHGKTPMHRQIDSEVDLRRSPGAQSRQFVIWPVYVTLLQDINNQPINHYFD
jgi:hypothetical protein